MTNDNFSTSNRSDVTSSHLVIPTKSVSGWMNHFEDPSPSVYSSDMIICRGYGPYVHQLILKNRHVEFIQLSNEIPNRSKDTIYPFSQPLASTQFFEYFSLHGMEYSQAFLLNVVSIFEVIINHQGYEFDKHPTQITNLINKILFWFVKLIHDRTLSENNELKTFCFVGPASRHEQLYLYFLQQLGLHVILIDYDNQTTLTLDKSLYTEFRFKESDSPFTLLEHDKNNSAITMQIESNVTCADLDSSLWFKPTSRKTQRIGTKFVISNLGLHKIGYPGDYHLYQLQCLDFINNLKNERTVLKYENSMVHRSDVHSLTMVRSLFELHESDDYPISGFIQSLRAAKMFHAFSNDFENTLLINLERLGAMLEADIALLKYCVVDCVYRFITDICKAYAPLDLDSAIWDLPVVLIRCDLTPELEFFITWLYQCGFDCMILHTYGDTSSIDWHGDRFETIPKLTHLHRTPLEVLPVVSKKHIRETVALQASGEFSNYITGESTGYYKPWQLDDFVLQPVQLKSTIDELLILWSEQARIRPGFQVAEHSVVSPKFTVKLSGVSPSLEEYATMIWPLIRSKHTVVYTHIPLNQTPPSHSDLHFASEILKSTESIDKRLIDSPLFSYAHLRENVQNHLLRCIKEILNNQGPIVVPDAIKAQALAVMLRLPDELVRLAQGFDKPFDIPKVVILDCDKHLFSTYDHYTLAMIHQMGFDLLIISPTGYSNIEHVFNADCFQTHHFETVSYDLSYDEICLMIKKSKKRTISNLFKK
ncbi:MULTISPECIES: YceG family protein [unclassified Fusibacter]|uniref:YceG family protein n=1 Tax=unclassified Fusibacter TaxID=2624464 RepID=UPI0010138B6B|nr:MULTISPECIES: YceG family protein [unclassified Fusibacter]MCK8061276.1 YceG family protein [Fusibacter sp. A2]NPE23526.1 hypothetical protein [Fusibacter sp. A1]RXV59130.1 hypothetical protein DWB64_17170 [Fusibacter sp. A1]